MCLFKRYFLNYLVDMKKTILYLELFFKLYFYKIFFKKNYYFSESFGDSHVNVIVELVFNLKGHD